MIKYCKNKELVRKLQTLRKRESDLYKELEEIEQQDEELVGCMLDSDVDRSIIGEYFTFSIIEGRMVWCVSSIVGKNATVKQYLIINNKIDLNFEVQKNIGEVILEKDYQPYIKSTPEEIKLVQNYINNKSNEKL